MLENVYLKKYVGRKKQATVVHWHIRKNENKMSLTEGQKKQLKGTVVKQIANRFDKCKKLQWFFSFLATF